MEQATECDPATGLPTESAEEALEFIQARTDYTLIPLQRRLERWGSPAPPEEIRKELWGQWDWACSWLNLNPDDVRQHGLPRAVGLCKWNEGGIYKTKPRTDGHIAGIPHVLEIRRQRLLEAQRKQATAHERVVHREPVAPLQPAPRILAYGLPPLQSYRAWCAHVGVQPNVLIQALRY